MRKCLVFLLIVLCVIPAYAVNQNIIGATQIPCQQQMPINATASAILLDAANESMAYIIRADQAKNISKLGFRTLTVTTGATVDVRLETVSATDGNPTGTLWATNTNNSQVIADTDDNTWFTVTLTANGTVAVGDVYAVVIVNPAVSPGNLNIAGRACATTSTNGVNYSTAFTGGAWGKNGFSGQCVYVEYSDGTVAVAGFMPSSSVTVTSFNTGSAADEIGNIFQFPFPTQCVGATLMGSATAFVQDFQVILYDSDGSTALATVTVDKDQVAGVSGSYYFRWAPVSLLANTNYRIVIKPTTGSSVDIVEWAVNAALTLDSYDGGQNFYKTARADAGSWTQTTTGRTSIAVLVQGYDGGGGSSTTAYTYVGN